MSKLLAIETDTVTLWEDPSRHLALTASRVCSSDFVRLIEQTRFGSGGLRYTRLGVAEALEFPSNNAHDAADVRNQGHKKLFISLTLNDNVVGTYVLASQPLTVSAEAMEGVYRSSLCVATDQQGNGYGQLIVAQTLKWLDARAGSAQVLSYGCIEKNNRRSLSVLAAAGARELGQLHTQMVYRQWPKRRVPVVRLDSSHSVATAGHEVYSDCGISYEFSKVDNCFAVVEGSSVLASANATIVRLCFDRIGQPWDFLSERLFKYVGPARRRFDPRNFTYLKLDCVVITQGHELLWRDFLDTLMAEHGVHMAMFALDPASQVSSRLALSGLLGRVAKATRQQLVVVGSAHGEPTAWLDHLGDQPVGLGPVGQ